MTSKCKNMSEWLEHVINRQGDSQTVICFVRMFSYDTWYLNEKDVIKRVYLPSFNPLYRIGLSFGKTISWRVLEVRQGYTKHVEILLWPYIPTGTLDKEDEWVSLIEKGKYLPISDLWTIVVLDSRRSDNFFCITWPKQKKSPTLSKVRHCKTRTELFVVTFTVLGRIKNKIQWDSSTKWI